MVSSCRTVPKGCAHSARCVKLFCDSQRSSHSKHVFFLRHHSLLRLAARPYWGCKSTSDSEPVVRSLVYSHSSHSGCSTHTPDTKASFPWGFGRSLQANPDLHKAYSTVSADTKTNATHSWWVHCCCWGRHQVQECTIRKKSWLIRMSPCRTYFVAFVFLDILHLHITLLLLHFIKFILM